VDARHWGLNVRKPGEDSRKRTWGRSQQGERRSSFGTEYTKDLKSRDAKGKERTKL